MADVELDVIDLSTGQSIGKFSLTLCEAKVYELDIGSYHFGATYLATGEAQQADINIIEGENPLLEFTFAAPPPPPPKHILTVNSAPIQGVPFIIERVS